MEKHEHEFFAREIVKFNALKDMVSAFARNLASLEIALVQYDNDYQAKDKKLKEKQVEIDALDRSIREKNAMANSGLTTIREQLKKQHLEIIKRESDLKYKEQLLAEQQKKANDLLVVAEAQAAQKRGNKIGVAI